MNKKVLAVALAIAAVIAAAVIYYAVNNCKRSCPVNESETAPIAAPVAAPVLEKKEVTETPAKETVTRKKKLPTNPISMGSAFDENGEEMQIPTDKELEKTIDRMLAEYRKMPAEQKAQMLEFSKHLPAMAAMQKVQMKKHFDSLSTENRAKAIKQMETIRPIMEKGVGMFEKKITEAEKKELTPFINAGRDMLDYAQQELTNPTPPAPEQDNAADLFTPGADVAE